MVEVRDLVGEVAYQAGDVGLAEKSRRLADDDRALAEADQDVAPTGGGDIGILEHQIGIAAAQLEHRLLQQEVLDAGQLTEAADVDELLDIVAVGGDVDWLPSRAAGLSLVIRDVTMSGQ